MTNKYDRRKKKQISFKIMRWWELPSSYNDWNSWEKAETLVNRKIKEIEVIWLEIDDSKANMARNNRDWRDVTGTSSSAW